MPNWCNNILTISHPDPAMMEKAVEAWNKGEFLQTFVPCPRALRETEAVSYSKTEDPETLVMIERQNALENINLKHYGHKNWYDWCVTNWGTKWDIGRREKHDQAAGIENQTMKVRFDSAWSPPTNAYDRLVELGFSVEAYYYEPGFDFCGEYIDGCDETFKATNAPKRIDDMFGITEDA